MRVLLAVDGSAHSDAAVEEVASRQWPSGTEVEVLTVVHSNVPLLPDPAFVMAAIRVERTHELLEQAPKLVDPAADRIRRQAPQLTVVTKVLEGSPAAVILKEAADWGADLIVLGSHGRSPVRQALLGSVASGVAAAAGCTVEIIKRGRPTATVRGGA
jgi:nucleotide-binding universal stress UspA family protein